MPPPRLLGALVVGLALTGSALCPSASGPFAPPRALAQDDSAAELRAIQDDLLAIRNDLLLRRRPSDLLDRVHDLLRRRNPRAEEGLREILLDTGVQGTEQVVLQIARAVLSTANPRLLDDVVERLRRERGTALDRELDPQWQRYAPGNIDRLIQLASDENRSVAYRSEAMRLIGKTRDWHALAPLFTLWGDPIEDLRPAAMRAFLAILPFPDPTRERARGYLDRVHVVGYAEVQREIAVELIAERGTKVVGAREWQDKYLELAQQLIERGDIRAVLEAALISSPAPEVRRAAADRIRVFDFSGIDRADDRAHAARDLLAALPKESDTEVELAVLRALANPEIAKVLANGLDSASVTALSKRVRDEFFDRAIRIATLDLIIAIRDPALLPVLQEAFVNLGGGDFELRIKLLETIQVMSDVPVEWLADQVASELQRDGDVRVMRKLMLVLGLSGEATAIEAVRPVLETHRSDVVRLDAARTIAGLWTKLLDAQARQALLDALGDSSPDVRSRCAQALAYFPPDEAVADRLPVIEALLTLLTSDEEAEDVRLAATASIWQLDSAGALDHLLPALHDAAVRKIYVERLVESAAAEGRADRILTAAAQLEVGHPTWAIGLLEHAARTNQVAGAPVLWQKGERRGLVRERLAELLIAERRPAEASAWLTELLAASDAQGARTDVWRILRGRARRHLGTRDQLLVAHDELLEVFGRIAELDAVPLHRARLRIEFGATLLALDDPAYALDVLRPATEIAAENLTANVQLELEREIAEAERRNAEEAASIRELVAALGTPGPDAQQAGADLRAARPQAMWHVLGALTASGGARDVALPWLRAAYELLGEKFTPPAADDPDALEKMIGRVCPRLRKAIDEQRAQTRAKR